MVQAIQQIAPKKPQYLYIIFVRHGERSDNIDADDLQEIRQVNRDFFESRIDHDPSLTPVGIAQASEAGEHFKKRIESVQNELGIQFDEVRVESSPFLRCLQTASRIALQLRVNYISTQYRVCESLKAEFFS